MFDILIGPAPDWFVGFVGGVILGQLTAYQLVLWTKKELPGG